MAGQCTTLSGKWNFSDYLGSLRTALGIRRNQYTVKPGLYSLGNPDKESPVLVTANYKLTVNILRRAVKNLNLWILVLDTKGVNVWCAAGKGTFGTDELINRIKESELENYVTQRKLVLPQLGAPGINPVTVKEKTGFSVLYGPVEASDLVSYIKNGFKASDGMRRKQFKLRERLAVALTHFTQGLKYSLALAFLFFIADLLLKSSTDIQFEKSISANILISLGSLFFGSILANGLLPVLPGRSFSIKGLFTGIIFSIITLLYLQNIFPDQSMFYLLGKITILSAFIVYQVLNLTGSSTYTSLSGVRKEMSVTIPVLIISLVAGIVLIVMGGLFV
jgi:CO dehydrogenase/acetyl-CoA synthase delta subunit